MWRKICTTVAYEAKIWKRTFRFVQRLHLVRSVFTVFTSINHLSAESNEFFSNFSEDEGTQYISHRAITTCQFHNVFNLIEIAICDYLGTVFEQNKNHSGVTLTPVLYLWRIRAGEGPADVASSIPNVRTDTGCTATDVIG